MRLSPILRFQGSADTSPAGSPEPDSRPNSPDSVHSNDSVKGHLRDSHHTAKDLLKQGLINDEQYKLLNGGIHRAHVEIQQKTGLARAWQAFGKLMNKKYDEVWDDLNETEEQLAAVQQENENAEAQMEIVQKALLRALSAPSIYKQTNGQIIQENVRLNRELHNLQKQIPSEPQEKQKQGNSAKKLTETPKKLTDTPEQKLFHQRPLQQRLLIRNKNVAEVEAKEAESSGSR